MSSSIKHIIAALVVLAFLYGVYFIASKSGVLESGIKTAEQVRTMTDQIEADILSDFTRIDSLTLDDEVFQKPEFNALIDTTVTLQPEPVTRSNPFAGF